MEPVIKIMLVLKTTGLAQPYVLIAFYHTSNTLVHVICALILLDVVFFWNRGKKYYLKGEMQPILSPRFCKMRALYILLVGLTSYATTTENSYIQKKQKR